VNLDETPRMVDVMWAQLNISGSWQVRDLWEHRDLGKHDEQLSFDSVTSHGVVLVRLSR